jgi:hypothetical protein
LEAFSNMQEFKSIFSYRKFAQEVRQKNRYFRSADSEDFLKMILETCQKRICVKPAGFILWRAQLGNDWKMKGEGELAYEIPCAYRNDRMKPLPNKADDGRINPRRIAYLYTATDIDTAIAEVRPWVGAYVSVGKFITQGEIRIIDCTQDRVKGMHLFTKEPPQEEKEKYIWGDVNYAFSYPVGPGDDYAAYAPTQIIAELFKLNGLDGIIYGSSLGGGENVCLFDLDIAKLTSGTLFVVTSVIYTISEDVKAQYNCD